MMEATTMAHFGDAMIGRVRALGHPLCVGLDPHLAHIPQAFRQRAMDPSDPATADAVKTFMVAVLDRLEGRVAIVKPQIALFEALGWRGLRVLTDLVRLAHGRGLMVLMDAKRGDIGSTAEGYATAYLAPGGPIPAHALTVNPYLGLDTLEPYLSHVRRDGRGIFVLVKTSNPGASDFQDRLVQGKPLFLNVAEALAPSCSGLAGPQTGWSAIGVVVGATYPAQAEQIRAALPKALVLVPGYGAQGGSAADAVRCFVPGPHGLEGGIVNSSRGILFPEGSEDANVSGWERAVDQALDRAIDELGAAVSL